MIRTYYWDHSKDDIEDKRVLGPISLKEERKAMELSPFELKNRLIEMAKKQKPDYLNAGRGNPDFFNAIARKAFCKLTYFAIDICDKEKNEYLGFRTGEMKGITKKFENYFKDDLSREVMFLKNAVHMAAEELKLNSDELLYELTDACRGDFYPTGPSDFAETEPPRILKNVEKIVNQYLKQILLKQNKTDAPFHLFATEGATAGMTYVFKSLQENFIANKGEKVAVITPVFSPYLEIPQLADFSFNLISIEADPEKPWEISENELNKLKDKSVKILYLINPTNPTSVALSEETIHKIKHIIKHDNHNLVVLVDAVYSTFTESYTSLIQEIPENCITVYSFSKYFGVTGWRLGVVMLNKKNIIDRQIGNLSGNLKNLLNQRYKIDSEMPSRIPFIDRLCMDSRDVALAHTAGISGPQQVMMALFSLFGILHQDEYKPAIKEILNKRMKTLYSRLSPLSHSSTTHDTNYYTLVNVLELAEAKHKGLGLHMVHNFYPIDFVLSLAGYTGAVCLPGYGFYQEDKLKDKDKNKVTLVDKNNWSIRISLANLKDEKYIELGDNICRIIEMYNEDYQKIKEQDVL